MVAKYGFPLAWALLAPAALASSPGVAFYYGARPPVAELGHFEQVVVEPGHVGEEELRALQAQSEVYAYLSVGEVSRASPLHARVQPQWVLGHNEAWGSDVLEPRRAEVQAFLLEQAEALWARGYRGLFLDTVDSPLAARGSEAERRARRQALAELLRELHRRRPGVRLLLNRGFELLPEVEGLVAGVVAESLFAGWNAAARRYEEVPAADRAWLLARLREVRERHGLPVTVVDYVPPAERERARAVARQIGALGFTPYVANGALDMLGVGAVEVVPRKVLALYDGAEGGPADSRVHQWLAVPLEALGLTLEYWNARQELPGFALAGRYAGVVAWLPGPLPRPEALRAWLERQCEEGVRLALWGDSSALQEPAALARWGLAPVALQRPVRLGPTLPTVGLEASPAVRPRALPQVRANSPQVRVHLAVVDAQGRQGAAIATGPCGGLVLGPYALEEGYAGQLRWVLDPAAFLQEALGLEPMPIPDPTTENGRRVLTLQVAGQGFATPSGVPGTPPAGQRVLEALLLRHRLPATLSLQERELRPPALQALARRLRALPYVEHLPGAEPGAECAGGGLGRLRFENDSLTGLSPLLCPTREGGLVPNAPLVDERAWAALAEPAYAYGRLAQVLQRTGHPRRLRPWALYHDFGAAADEGGLRALQALYEQARAAPVLPLWLSEYKARVQGFAQATLARGPQGSWHVRGLGALRTLRLPAALGWPQLEHSPGVAGAVEVPEGRYVSLSGPQARLTLAATPPAGPHLAWANAPLLAWQRSPQGLRLHLRGHVPLSFALAGLPPRCRLLTPSGAVPGTAVPGATAFLLPTKDTGHARLLCP